jgi:NAD(P)-dependent dehydrogenase (short-subunit alcohol dehydrogenase family)
MSDNDALAGRRLGGQVAVITGAAQGIGRAIAIAFAAAGAQVVIADLRLDQAHDVEQTVAEAGGDALACEVDVANPESVAALFARVTEVFGRMDLLVNNAGICPVTAFPSVDLAVWRQVFAVNVEGPLIATQIAATIMQGQEPHPISGCRGKIINVSSPAAEIGRPLFAAYGASKAALNHLTKTAAVVLEPALISTSALYPGSVKGPLWDALMDDLVAADGRDRESILAERTAGMPRGRFQFPEEVAAMALYIAAYPGMALNGQVLWSEPHVTTL